MPKIDKQIKIMTGGLVALTVLSSIMLTNPLALADDSHIDTMSVSVPESCTLTSSGVNSHNAEINNGQTNDQIGTTTVQIFCNDNTGYALYAIGYTDNEYGKTVLTNSALGSSFDIATATTVTTGTSSWAMKLTKTGSEYLPIIAGSSADTNAQSGDPDFSGYTAVPEEYTKVAYFPSSTDIGSGASGSNLTTTYRAYISQTQPAGTYAGQVKYTLVHPNTASAPTPVYTMQNVASWKNKITTGQEVTVKDARDGKEYTVAKLADGNIWMTQNLDHDIDATYDYDSTNTDVPSNWNDTLTNTYATGTTTWNASYTAPESYDPGDLCWNGTFAPNYSGTLSTYAEACGNDKHYHIGNYYNWTAAVAMADSSSYTARNTDVNQSICPAGWMLPKSGTTLTGSGSFIYLRNQLSLTSGTSGNIQNSPVYFAYGGSWYGSSIGVSGFGGYWSSVVSSSGNACRLGFISNGNLSPQGNDGRNYGYLVRCVAR